MGVRGKIPQIKWGSSFANTLDLGYPLDQVVTYSMKREGSERAESSAGVIDAWLTGFDYFLEGDARWIPGVSGTTPRGDTITGWDGATGWEQFLQWAWQMNPVRFIYDKTASGVYVDSYLIEPDTSGPQLEGADQTRRLHLKLQNASTTYAGY